MTVGHCPCDKTSDLGGYSARRGELDTQHAPVTVVIGEDLRQELLCARHFSTWSEPDVHGQELAEALGCHVNG